jgi:hypothetical protein
MNDIIESIPDEWEVVVYDNSKREDYSVFGRYAAIELTDAELIYVQDDDCVLDPQEVADAYEPGKLTANMPERFRHDFYTDHCLVGFGAIFDRDLPAAAFDRFFGKHLIDNVDPERFYPTCDVVFTALTERVLVDVSHRDLPWASDPDRMWKQPSHVPDRAEMRKLALACR